MFEVVSDFSMLRCVIGFEYNELAALLNLYLSRIRKALPKVPAKCDENIEQVGERRLNCRLITFLTFFVTLMFLQKTKKVAVQKWIVRSA